MYLYKRVWFPLVVVFITCFRLTGSIFFIHSFTLSISLLKTASWSSFSSSSLDSIRFSSVNLSCIKYSIIFIAVYRSFVYPSRREWNWHNRGRNYRMRFAKLYLRRCLGVRDSDWRSLWVQSLGSYRNSKPSLEQSFL